MLGLAVGAADRRRRRQARRRPAAPSGLRVDRLLVGIGMIPRGEVGIIFASIGLAEGVFGDDQYAALLIVILVTTLMTPPLLRWRIAGLRVAERSGDADDDGGTASGTSPWSATASCSAAGRRPPTRCPWPSRSPAWRRWRHLTRRSSTGSGPGRQRPGVAAGGHRRRWSTVLRTGDARSLRFLDVTGVLDRALPEVGEALARRRADPGELDPTRVLQLPTVQRIADDADRTTLLAALVADVCATGAPGCAESLAARLDPGAAAQIVDAVHGSRAARRRPGQPRCARRGEHPPARRALRRRGRRRGCPRARRRPPRRGRLAAQGARRDPRPAAHGAVASRRCAAGRTTLVDTRRATPRSARLGPHADVARSASGEGVADVPRVPRPGRARPPGVAGRRAATTRRRSCRRRRARRARDVPHRRVVPRPPRPARPAHRRASPAPTSMSSPPR